MPSRSLFVSTARSPADISGSKAMSPTSWRLTSAATDACEDPAQYGRLSAPWTGIQQITNGAHIGGSARAYLADSSRRQPSAIMGIHGMIASVLWTFMQSFVFLERAMPLLVREIQAGDLADVRAGRD
jgi:hypothetical protein